MTLDETAAQTTGSRLPTFLVAITIQPAPRLHGRSRKIHA
jgi:hypothetical protein